MESLLRQIGLALLAVEFATEIRSAAFWGEDPFAERPRWIMADMLRVATGEVSDPMTLNILVERDDFAEDGHRRFDYRGRGSKLNRYATLKNDVRALVRHRVVRWSRRCCVMEQPKLPVR